MSKKEFKFSFILGILIFSIIIANSPAYAQNEKEEYSTEYIQSLILVLSPIVAGAFVTSYLTKSWQQYKHKIEIKHDLLESFQNAAWKVYNLQTAFFLKMLREYKLQYNENSAKSVFLENDFSFEKDGYPEKIFESEYEEFRCNVDDARLSSHKFASKIKLYLDHSKLSSDYQEIRDRARVTSDQLIAMLHTKKEVDFLEHAEVFDKEIKQNRKLIDLFEKTLVDTKIRKIPV